MSLDGFTSIPLWRRAALAALRVQVNYTDTTRALLSAPCILTCNHESMIDGIAIALASPVPLTFAVTHDYAVENPATAKLLAFLARRGLGEVRPVDPDRPYAMRSLGKALSAGRSVMIFPTGTIHPGAPEQPGYAWLARYSGCPVVRASINGASRSRIFSLSKSVSELRPRIVLTL